MGDSFSTLPKAILQTTQIDARAQTDARARNCLLVFCLFLRLTRTVIITKRALQARAINKLVNLTMYRVIFCWLNLML